MSTMTLCAHSRSRREARLRWLVLAILLPTLALLALHIGQVREKVDAVRASAGAALDSVSRDGRIGQDAASIAVDLGRALKSAIDHDFSGQAPTSLTLTEVSGCRVEVVEAAFTAPCDATVFYVASGESFALRVVDRHGTSSTFNPAGLPDDALVEQYVR
ncbi:hypothetical protein [Nocardioides sp. KR10-350]|uniref:hypothetical protein n=1 Tax=Nocardioides cheoyonin TaxID=3156615 RepID=UPI0032B5B298